MPDHSAMDNQYFIDEQIYNCPFCNRRHVTYFVTAFVAFNWTNDKVCHAYFVKCGSCGQRSMHLTFHEIDLDRVWVEGLGWTQRFDVEDETVLDDLFFYSVPTSFAVLDENIPRVLRELLTEAEGCLKGGFLTGASACARKMIYELAVLEEASGTDYEDKIKSLKSKRPEIDPTFFDTLLTIQSTTSSKVHERSFDGWESRHLRVILAALREILHELFVAPVIRASRRKAVLALKDEVGTSKSSKPSGQQKLPPAEGEQSSDW